MKNILKNYALDTMEAIEGLAEMILEEKDRQEEQKEKRLVPIECHSGSRK